MISILELVYTERVYAGVKIDDGINTGVYSGSGACRHCVVPDFSRRPSKQLYVAGG